MNIRIFFGLLIITSQLFSCDGNCLSCHPSLSKNGLDENHKILSSCIKCHETSSNDLEKMNALCGQDCWDCHNVNSVMNVKKENKIIMEHTVLNTCIQCHKKLQNNKLLFLSNQILN